MKDPPDRERMKILLASDMPGTKAQQIMAPEERLSVRHESDPVPAAVMLILYPSGMNRFLVFIKRNEYDGPHSGQISFPGGAREPGDGSAEETAVRETREELGITDPIEVLGPLTSLHIPVSNFMVFPFVGWMEQRPQFQPDKGEVQYIIEVPLHTLLRNGSRETCAMYRKGKWIETPFYRVGGEKIWGATAMILSEFLQLVSRLQ